MQIQKAQHESPIALVVGQTDQVVGDFDILCGMFCLIAKAGLVYAEYQLGQPNADALFYGPLRHLASARWLYHFFQGLLDYLRLEAFFGMHL